MNTENLNKFSRIPDNLLQDVTETATDIQHGKISEMLGATETAQNGDVSGIQPEIQTGPQTQTLPPQSSTGSTFMQQPVQSAQSLNVGSFLEGKTVVEIADSMLPALLVLALSKFAGLQVQKSQLQFTAREKAVLSPLVDRVLESQNIQVTSPINALLIALAGIYAAKFADALPTAQKVAKKPQTATKPVEAMEAATGTPKGRNGLPLGKGSRGPYKKQKGGEH